MGYSTIIHISNDAFDCFKKNAEEFFSGISRAMQPYDDKKIHDVSVGHYANYLQVRRSEHSMIPVCTLVHHGCMMDMADVDGIRPTKESMKWFITCLNTVKTIINRSETEFLTKLLNIVYPQIQADAVCKHVQSPEELEDILDDNKFVQDMHLQADQFNLLKLLAWERYYSNCKEG